MVIVVRIFTWSLFIFNTIFVRFDRSFAWFHRLRYRCTCYCYYRILSRECCRRFCRLSFIWISFYFFRFAFFFRSFFFFLSSSGGRNNHWEIFDNRHQNFLLAHGIQTFRKLSLWMNDFCRLVRLPKHIKSIKVSPSHRFYAWHHTFALKFSFPHHF